VTDCTGVKATIRQKRGAASVRPIRKLVHGVLGVGKPKGSTPGGVGKPIVRSLRGTWCARHQSTSGYPKPADLCLGRVKRRETGVEARSRNDVQIFGVTWV
jgi:hypothetical protein